MSSYQWYRVDKVTRAFIEDIAGATGPTYRQSLADTDHIVKCKVTISGETHSTPDDGVYADTVTSPAPPPGSFGPYKWDAAGGVLMSSQTRATLIKNSRWMPGGVPMASFGAEAAVIYPPAGTPNVGMTWSPDFPHTPATIQMPIPPGTRNGGANDHHLVVVRSDGVVFQMELANLTSHTAYGIGIVQLGKTNEGSFIATGMSDVGPYDSVQYYGGSNAANLDMSKVISADDVKNWNLKTLQFGMPIDAHVTNDISVYPSPPHIFNDAAIPYGQFARLDPAGTVPAYTNVISHYIDACLRKHGMVLRDQAGGLTIYAFDHVNQGGNQEAWAEVGVTLNLAGLNGYNIGCYLPGIPWEQLQVLEPPTAP